MRNVLLYILILLNCSLVFASPESINPDKVVVNLFKVFSGAKIKANKVEVRGPSFRNQDAPKDGAKRFNIPLEVFQRAQTLGQSVFSTLSGEGDDFHGTSFSIGENLILTNQHVLSPSRKNSTKCRNFSIRTNDKKSEKFICEEVLYCETKRDFCLIKIKSNSKRKRLKGKRVLILSQLSRIPGLKLDISFRLGETGFESNENFSTLGNTSGFGIHYSQGKHAQLIHKDIAFFSPLSQGNSGGPLLNEAGHVIGIVKQQSSTFYGTGYDVFNVAIPIREVVETLREKLQNRPEVLAKLNKAILVKP